jgi:hypothetical protein
MSTRRLAWRDSVLAQLADQLTILQRLRADVPFDGIDDDTPLRHAVDCREGGDFGVHIRRYAHAELRIVRDHFAIADPRRWSAHSVTSRWFLAHTVRFLIGDCSNQPITNCFNIGAG